MGTGLWRRGAPLVIGVDCWAGRSGPLREDSTRTDERMQDGPGIGAGGPEGFVMTRIASNGSRSDGSLARLFPSS